MKFRRGFKQDCELLVAEIREELGLRVEEPINMSRLAHRLEIPVKALAAFIQAAKTGSDGNIEEIYEKVSAFTVFDEAHRTIVFNERHTAARQRSDLAHELAHALLHHPHLGASLSKNEEAIHEREASWMGGVLMLTRPQAHHLARLKMPMEVVMERFGISMPMLRFRMNVTGAARVAA